MRKHLVLVAMLLLSTALVSVAQDFPTVVADIPFSFTAGGKTLPAGQYQFGEGSLGKEMVIRGENTKADVIAPVVTRLGERPGDQAEVVFDKVENDYYLSELHIPGMDGYLFKGAPGKHTHVRVRARRHGAPTTD
jgi:hypothetical protein